MGVARKIIILFQPQNMSLGSVNNNSMILGRQNKAIEKEDQVSISNIEKEKV